MIIIKLKHKGHLYSYFEFIVMVRSFCCQVGSVDGEFLVSRLLYQVGTSDGEFVVTSLWCQVDSNELEASSWQW